MAVETHIRSKLAATPDVSALVGEDNGTGEYARIYYTDVKQDTVFPAISIQQISNFRTRTLAGPDGWAQPRLQIDCWAQTWTAARDLAEKVRIALDGYKGTVDSDLIGEIEIINERTFFEPDPKLHRVSMDALIWHTEKRA